MVCEAVENSRADLFEEKIRSKRMAMFLVMYDTGWTYAFGDDGEVLVAIRERELEDGSRVIGPIRNPAIEGDLRNSSRAYKLMEELQLFPTPDGRPALAHD